MKGCPGLSQIDYDELLALEGMPCELLSLFEDGVHVQYPQPRSTPLEIAGVDAGTDSDVFMQMNGRNIFLSGEQLNGPENRELD